MNGVWRSLQWWLLSLGEYIFFSYNGSYIWIMEIGECQLPLYITAGVCNNKRFIHSKGAFCREGIMIGFYSILFHDSRGWVENTKRDESILAHSPFPYRISEEKIDQIIIGFFFLKKVVNISFVALICYSGGDLYTKQWRSFLIL